jgi:hypothetical protein
VVCQVARERTRAYVELSLRLATERAYVMPRLYPKPINTNMKIIASLILLQIINQINEEASYTNHPLGKLHRGHKETVCYFHHSCVL